MKKGCLGTSETSHGEGKHAESTFDSVTFVKTKLQFLWKPLLGEFMGQPQQDAHKDL